MNKTLKIAALALALTVPFAAQAHKAWLQPSQTVLAGNNPWVTVDAAVSNDLFYFNHVPLKTDNLTIIAPDGSTVAAQNAATGKYRTVFDVELKQTGTYRIGVVNNYITGSWEVDGKPAADLEVEITRGGTRYRNAQDELKVKTNAQGEFAVTWPEAGMYWVEANSEDNKTTVKQAKQRRLSYVATLEVLPQ